MLLFATLWYSIKWPNGNVIWTEVYYTCKARSIATAGFYQLQKPHMHSIDLFLKITGRVSNVNQNVRISISASALCCILSRKLILNNKIMNSISFLPRLSWISISCYITCITHIIFLRIVSAETIIFWIRKCENFHIVSALWQFFTSQIE